MMDFTTMITIVLWLASAAVLVLGPLILVHELGHFISAKLAGVRIEEFGIGFPPRLVKLWSGKGYLEVDGVRVIVPRNYPLPAKLLVGAHIEILAQRRENGDPILTELHLYDEEPQEAPPMHEEEGELLRLRGEATEVERGTVYSLNWLPIGAFVKMTGEEDPSDKRSLAAQPKRWRLLVLAAGAALNIIAAIVLMISVYLSGIPEKWLVQIRDVAPGSAAEAAGIQPLDIIVAIDGERIAEGGRHVQRLVQPAAGKTLKITIQRGEQTLELPVTPRACREEERATLGCKPGNGLLGITMASWPDRSSVHYYSLPEAARLSFETFRRLFEQIAGLPGRISKGTVTPEEVRPTSMVGVSQVLTFFLQQSIEWRMAFPVLQAAAGISLALGVTNLLPLPALDGGRILFVLIEAVRGRRISPEREAMVHFVGLVVLVTLMLLVMLYDLVNPIFSWSMIAR